MSPVLIFDLDDAMLSINSYPVWVLAMLLGKINTLPFGKRLLLSLQTAKLLLAHTFFGKSREHVVRELQILWRDSTGSNTKSNAMNILRGILQNKIRSNFYEVLECVAAGKFDAVLATSAAGAYVHDFANSLGFRHVLATEIDGNKNEALEKRRRVLSLLAENGLDAHRRVLFTAHGDDLPLILESQLVFWFGSPAGARFIKTLAPDIEVVACRDLPSEEIMKRLS